MKHGTFLVLVATALVCGAAFATGVRGSDSGAPLPILEISPMSVTVDAGKDIQESYTITQATTATLNGLAVRPEDLRAGMLASFTLASDNKTIVALHAQDAPRATKKVKVDRDNVNVNVNLVK